MIEFKPVLQQRLIDILTTAVGAGSDPGEFIKTFDTRLTDVDITQLPYIVVNARMAEKVLPGEIGNQYQKYTWTVNIYYIDMETNPNAYVLADTRRDHLLARVEKALETNKFLADPKTGVALVTQDADGHREYVYDTSIQAITFDDSGQEDHHSFVSELFLEVYTDRS